MPASDWEAHSGANWQPCLRAGIELALGKLRLPSFCRQVLVSGPKPEGESRPADGRSIFGCQAAQ